MRNLETFRTVTAAVVAVTAAAVVAAVAPVSAQDDAVNRAWLDRLDDADRALVDENIGYAPPAMTEKMRANLSWHGTDSLSWEELRGKVVVVQSWTSKTSAGRAAPTRAERALARLDENGYTIIAIHTPEGAENVEQFLTQRELNMPVLVDSNGLLLDELGMYQRPTNIVIDRNGKVRYAGLNARGLQAAVGELTKEPFDETAVPEPRPEPEGPAMNDVEFPSPNQQQLSASNLQGQRSPDLFVQQWLNGQPDARGKVVIVDFWATWCGPCVASIPHMNDIANEFRADLVAVGLSDEAAGTVQSFMRQRRMDYAVATDSNGRMKRAVGVRGIPHVMVMSSDWVVRWQGHPSLLTRDLVSRIVEANRQLVGAASALRRYRWTGA